MSIVRNGEKASLDACPGGDVIYSGPSSTYRPADLWEYILGPSLPVDSEWHGVELVRQIKTAYDKCNRPYDNIPLLYTHLVFPIMR